MTTVTSANGTSETIPASPAHRPTVTHVNPTPWAAAFGYDQGQLRPAPRTLLTIAGQGPVDEHGVLLHADDVSAQLSLTMANVEAVLSAAGMDLGDVLRLVVYTTDVDATLAAYDAITERLRACAATPPTTLLGVQRLALAGMVVEIDATAGR